MLHKITPHDLSPQHRTIFFAILLANLMVLALIIIVGVFSTLSALTMMKGYDDHQASKVTAQQEFMEFRRIQESILKSTTSWGERILALESEYQSHQAKPMHLGANLLIAQSEKRITAIEQEVLKLKNESRRKTTEGSE